MKNLFKYATKELSQDAFLCWMFANYDCEQEEVSIFSRYMLSWLISDSLSIENSNLITSVDVVKQFKNIDILIKCSFQGVLYVIIIEDKINSTEHNEQLNRYKDIIKNHYNTSCQKRYVFFKTDIIGKEEITNLNAYSEWKIKQVKDIFEVFQTFLKSNNKKDFDNEILHYYYENLSNIFNAISNRPQKVSDWQLHSWHSFFEDYTPICGLLYNTEIRAYQKQYYYYKFIIDGHEKDLPSIEVRSRDYDKEKNTLKFRVVVYNVEPNNITAEIITEWKNILTANSIRVCNRKDITKNKQIGIFKCHIKGDNEKALKNVFDKVGHLLKALFAL